MKPDIKNENIFHLLLDFTLDIIEFQYKEIYNSWNRIPNILMSGQNFNSSI